MVSKEIINKTITDIINNNLNIDTKCSNSGTKESSGKLSPPPKFTPSKEKFSNKELNEIADAMAERYGLEVSINSKGKREIGQAKFSLWDDKNKTEIKLGKIVKHQEWIDFGNNGKGVYNLDEVLGYYDELSPIQKSKPSVFVFETKKGACYNQGYEKGLDQFNTIHITNQVYHNRHSRFNLKQAIGHETAHASERTFSDELKAVLRKASTGNNTYSRAGLSRREDTLIMDYIKGNRKGRTTGNPTNISSSVEYDNARNQNKMRHASSYSASYGAYGRQSSEDFAETMSAVSYRNSDDKSDFSIKYLDGRIVGWDEFVSDHQATYDLCCDWVDGKIKPESLSFN